MPPLILVNSNRSALRVSYRNVLFLNSYHQPLRYQSSSTSHASQSPYGPLRLNPTRTIVTNGSSLSRLPMVSMLRTLLLSSFFSRPAIFTFGLSIMRTIANSKSVLLNPDKNFLLRAVLKPLIYNQFCAGTNPAEIKSTAAQIKGLGFSGVILCYGREVLLDQDAQMIGHVGKVMETEINQWKEGNLKTLSMIGKGDWLGIKFTGAGNKVTEALLKNESAPSLFLDAMDAICQEATTRGCRIWIDAEQQAIQSVIDQWTMNLMKRWNTSSKPLIYNTVQSYLKQSRNNLSSQLETAQQEGFSIGIKLVRGAYISNETRSLIHDTKANTDDSYNGIVSELLRGIFPGFSGDERPNLELFLAGHNRESIQKATTLARELSMTGTLKVSPEFGQLQGMADDIGCEILECGDKARNENQKLGRETAHVVHVPLVYKCLTWGSVQECMQYLVRRAIENQGAAERIKDGSAGYAKEIRRRIMSLEWIGLGKRDLRKSSPS